MVQRVCMFGSEIAPSEGDVYIGGAVSNAVNVSRALADLGLDVHVLTTPPRDWEDVRSEIQTDWGTITVFDARSQHPSLFDGVDLFLKGTSRLVRYCRTNDIDVIHSHSGYSVLAAMSVTAGQILGVPVYHSLYCPVPRREFNGVDERLSSPWWTRRTLNRVTHVFALSEYVQRSLTLAGVGNVSVVPPIVDTDEFRPGLPTPESTSIDDDRFTIAFVGSLKPEKGLEYLIEAMGHLKEDIPLELILTTERDFPGSDERKQYLEAVIDDAGVRDRITVLGIVPDMARILANVDVLVAPFVTTQGPSDYPIAVLEAMACGTPVVGSRVGGIPELLNDGRGYLCDAGSSQSLATALRRVYEDSDDSERLRTYVGERFAGQTVAQQIRSHYRCESGR